MLRTTETALDCSTQNVGEVVTEGQKVEVDYVENEQAGVGTALSGEAYELRDVVDGVDHIFGKKIDYCGVVVDE